MATQGYLTGTLILALLSTLACGDDGESPSAADATTREDAGTREDVAPASPARGLADGIVGKPCAEASECGTGSCLTTLRKREINNKRRNTHHERRNKRHSLSRTLSRLSR